MTDEELLEKYEGLIKKLSYTNSVYGFANEDLQQEFRMLLLTCNKKFDPSYGYAFSTYFVKSCKNKISKLRRKEENFLSLNNEMERSNGQEFLEMIETKVVNPLEEMLDMEMGERIMRYLDELPYGFYTKMYLLYGIPQNEIANIEGTDRFMVSRRHNENLKILRRKFKN